MHKYMAQKLHEVTEELTKTRAHQELRDSPAFTLRHVRDTVTYFGFHKGGKFSLATNAYTRGGTMIVFLFFSYGIFLPKLPNAHLNTPLAWHDR